MIKLSEKFSIGVAAEIKALEGFKEQFSRLKDLQSPEAYYKSENFSSYLHYPPLIKDFSNLKILDVGVGAGASSVFLASKGHKVWAVEPMMEFCKIIEDVAEKFSLPISVCNGVAEDIDNLDIQFDMVIFNSSLHHCDDPLRALRACFNKLKKGGIIYLVNENYIRPWRTQKWFNRMLEKYPQKMGHYGGNEHVYYNWQYCSFLRQSKFTNIKYISPNWGSPLDRIEFYLKIRMNGERLEGNPIKIIFKLMYYVLINKTRNFNLIYKLSLASCQFSAIKN